MIRMKSALFICGIKSEATDLQHAPRSGNPPPCQTSCRPIMIAESPHRIDIYEPKCVFN